MLCRCDDVRRSPCGPTWVSQSVAKCTHRFLPSPAAEEPLLSLMDRPDKNYDATVIQWGTHVATGATHQAVAGEAMVVCVDVGNPLHVPVRMTAVTLDW